MPLFSTVSFLEPVRNQNPKDTVLTYGIVSVTTLIPFGKIVFWYKQSTSPTAQHNIPFIIDSILRDVNEIPENACPARTYRKV
jgi:hypothetical protein